MLIELQGMVRAASWTQKEQMYRSFQSMHLPPEYKVVSAASAIVSRLMEDSSACAKPAKQMTATATAAIAFIFLPFNAGGD